MEPKLKASGSKPLKLKYDKLHSNVAFKSNLRRYSMVIDGSEAPAAATDAVKEVVAIAMAAVLAADTADTADTAEVPVAAAAKVLADAAAKDLVADPAADAAAVDGVDGRDLHLSTSQLNLSHF